MCWRYAKKMDAFHLRIVLILLVMDYVLEAVFQTWSNGGIQSLNPSCNGLCVGGDYTGFNHLTKKLS